MIVRSLSLALFVSAGALVSAQAVNTAAIDSFVNAERERQHIPGIAVAVMKDGRPVFMKGYGLANLEKNQAATPKTAFSIGSVSKQFLAYGALKLQQQGKLGLDDPLAKYFPDAPEAWRKITVRHLISHTAGLPRELTGWNAIAPYTDQDWLRLAYATRPVTEPGARWAYSNAGYFILAMTITRAAGRPWGEYMEEEVFRPLAMNSTRVALPSLVVPNRAEGYVWNGQKWQDDGPINSVRPSGAFVSTLADLVRWEDVLAAGKADFALLSQPTKLADGQPWPYGLGWYLDNYGTYRVVHHGGGIAGFRSEFMRFPERGLTVILVTNIAVLNIETIAYGVARRALPELVLTRGRPRRDPNPSLTGQIQAFLRQVANREAIDENLVTPPLRQALTGFPAAMRDELKGAKTIAFLREDDVSRLVTTRQGQRIGRVRYYRLGDLYVTAYFAPDGKLAFFETSNDQP